MVSLPKEAVVGGEWWVTTEYADVFASEEDADPIYRVSRVIAADGPDNNLYVEDYSTAETVQVVPAPPYASIEDAVRWWVEKTINETPAG